MRGCIQTLTLKRLKSIFAAAVLAALLAGCAPGVIKQTSSPDLPPVDPRAQVTTAKRNARIYFRVDDEPYISSVLRRIEVKADATAEAAALQALIAGPDTNTSSLTPLIPPDTEIVSIHKEEGLLFLTLSAEFVGPTASLPDNWAQNMELRESVALEKRLALSAIANTLTELGADRVQISVDMSKSSPLDDAPAEVLTLLSSPDPISYSLEYVLTPSKALAAALESVMQLDWERVARLCVSSSGEALTDERVSKELKALGMLTDYSLEGDSTASDGATATVIASVSIRGGDGLTRENGGIPVRAHMINDVFRVDYEALLRLLGGSDE